MMHMTLVYKNHYTPPHNLYVVLWNLQWSTPIRTVGAAWLPSASVPLRLAPPSVGRKQHQWVAVTCRILCECHVREWRRTTSQHASAVVSSHSFSLLISTVNRILPVSSKRSQNNRSNYRNNCLINSSILLKYLKCYLFCSSSPARAADSIMLQTAYDMECN